MGFKPRLLRETAEIALTEIKRFIEPRLSEDFSLRRVSAPMFLPVGSELLTPGKRGAVVRLDASGTEVEIVGSLDVWLRGQLLRYDIAPGFGVFTIMNGLRPDLPDNSTSSPHVAAWAWQQAVEQNQCNPAHMVAMARKVHKLLVDTEKMVLSLFPHLHATLSRDLEEMAVDDMARLYPGLTHERRVYEHLHPERKDDAGECRQSVLLVWHTNGGCEAVGELWVWNRIIEHPVMLADFGAWGADGIAGCSLGGNIWRNFLALQILHQDRLMGE